MDKTEKDTREYYTIDIPYIVKSLRRRAWIIAVCGFLAAAIGFSLSAFVLAPTYSSYIKLYVNNVSISPENENFSITSSELTAAQALVRTYGDILDSRSTLERVIEQADVSYTWKELSDMIEYAPSNETEIMRVSVTCNDPHEASKIANTIAEVLPVRVSEIIEGASIKVIDSAIPDLDKVGPSITKYTAIGFVLGVLVSVIVLIVVALTDDTVHDEDHVLRTYDYPLLGRVPDYSDSTAAEQYKLIRANLGFTLPRDGKCPVVGVTGAMRGEGRSTAAINLSYVFAEKGGKVLLVDADFRNSSFAEKLGIDSSPGLADLLRENEVQISEFRSHLLGNRFVLPSGDIPSNPSELLGSSRMEDVLNQLRKVFDYIIIDLPSVNTVSDAISISGLVSGMIVVIREEYTEKKELERCFRQLKLSGTNILGCVMNGASPRRHNKHSK